MTTPNQPTATSLPTTAPLPAASTPLPAATIVGYPRIGPDRELKKAEEAYWAGRIDRTRRDDGVIDGELGHEFERRHAEGRAGIAAQFAAGHVDPVAVDGC